MVKTADAAYDEAETRKRKVCRVCGKDLRGHRRIRDGDRYICPVCDEIEREGQAPDGLPCAECGKRVHPGALRRWGAIQLCPKCYTEHQDAKHKIRQVDTGHFDEERKRQLLVLGGVLAVLLLLMLLAWLL